MELSFDNSDLEELGRQPECKTTLPAPIVREFRKKLQMLSAAPSQNSFKNLKSMQIIPLKGTKAKKFFVELGDGWDLILSFQGREQVKIIEVHKN
jgi:toxin HigB-1